VIHVPPGTSAVEFEEARANELSDSHTGPYEVLEVGDDRAVLRRMASLDDKGAVVGIEKRFTFDGERRSPAIRLEVRVENHGSSEIVADLAIEWPVMLLGGGANPAAWYEVDGVRTAHDGRGERPALQGVASGNDYIGIRLTTSIEPAATAWWSPIETISNSELGFERVYQGSAFVAVWPINLAPGERVTVAIHQQVATDRDRSDEASG